MRRGAVAAAAVVVGLGLVLVACSASSSRSAVAHPTGAGTGAATGAAASDQTKAAATPSVATPSLAGGVARQACALVTRQEAGAAVGHDPGAGRPFASHGSSQCQYGSYQTGLVLVNLTPTRGIAGYDHIHDDPRVSKGGTVVDLSGVGDRAFEVSGPNTAGIYFDKGDALILVTVSILGRPTPPKAQVLALARAAADRS